MIRKSNKIYEGICVLSKIEKETLKKLERISREIGMRWIFEMGRIGKGKVGGILKYVKELHKKGYKIVNSFGKGYIYK